MKMLSASDTVVQIRSVEKDGYDGLQLGVGERKEGRLSKALRSHMNKAGRANFARLFEVRVDDISQYTVGQEISVADVFAVGDTVDVSGTTKGRGFSGVMRRHNYLRAGGLSTTMCCSAAAGSI